MNTVNFRCGHCGQLLAVQAQFLGQQVRCPHCQKVVVAPPAAAPPPVSPPPSPAPAPLPPTMDVTFQYTPPEEHESIFSAPTSGSEDLFGQPSGAKVDLPTEVMHPVETSLEAFLAASQELIDRLGRNIYLSDTPIIRPPDQTFNPRVSRVLQLAIENIENCEVETLLNLLKLVPEWNRLCLAANFNEMLELRKSQRHELAAVLILDLLRHLHQSTWDLQNRQNFVTLLAQELKAGHYKGLLANKLETSIAQQTRLLEAQRDV